MEPGRPEASGVEVSRLSDADNIDRLLALFEQVALEEGWHSNGELAVYRRCAWHVGATVDGALAGGIQIARRDETGKLPYQAVWPDVVLSNDTPVVEVTVLAVNKRFRRNTKIFWGLCVELWRLCVEENVSEFVLEATPEMLTRYRKLGWPLIVIGELRLHFGEPCFLCRLDTNSVAGSLIAMSLQYPSFRSVVSELTRPLTGRVQVQSHLGRSNLVIKHAESSSF